LTLIIFSIILIIMNPLNLYSAPLLILFVILLAGLFLLRPGLSLVRLLVLALLTLGMAVIWYRLRPVQTPHTDVEDLRSQISAGTPVLLEFQSPY